MKKIVDKRTALLEAALELFAENGFNGSPTALIAKRAGVASGTLFFYFKTKEELIRELFFQIRGEIDNLALENTPEEWPIQERFLQAFSHILRYFLQNPRIFAFMEQYHFSPLRERGCNAPAENEKFRELLILAREQKAIKDAPLFVLEALAFGPIASVAKEHASRGTAIDEETISLVVQGCWDGLKR